MHTFEIMVRPHLLDSINEARIVEVPVLELITEIFQSEHEIKYV